MIDSDIKLKSYSNRLSTSTAFEGSIKTDDDNKEHSIETFTSPLNPSDDDQEKETFQTIPV